MVMLLDPVSRLAYDQEAATVGERSSASWATTLATLEPIDRPRYLRARCRWRVDAFASLVMHPVLARIGPVSEQNEIDDYVFGLPPKRVGQRVTTQRILMTGRGIGKTTRLKIRALHGMLYGCTRVAAAIGSNEEESTGWVSTLADWLKNAPDELRALFPELEYHAKERSLWLRTRFGESTLLARSFTGGLRGMNVNGRRPDALYLDDIEGEDRSITRKARDRNQMRLTKKVLPLVPLEGGAEVWWVQTPVHHDCVAVRALKGHDELRGWTCRRIPVVRRWPDIDPEGKATAELWAENKRIFFDVDTYGEDKEARTAAARSHFDEHRDAMSEGAIVLDPTRMPIDAAYRKRWEIGETAWATEFAVDVAAPGADVFSPDTWPRYEHASGHLRIHGRDVAYASMQLAAHYDPSDGGDDGALVVVGRHGGRYYLLAATIWESAKLSQQIAGIPAAVAKWVKHGLRVLQWEPTTGSASVIADAIREALADAGLRVALEDRHSTERKEARIVGTLEPKGAAGLLAIPTTFPLSHEALIRDFHAGRRDNRDDLLDAFQRAVERLESGDKTPDADAVLAALESGDW
jgi:hypothetical protein